MSNTQWVSQVQMPRSSEKQKEIARKFIECNRSLPVLILGFSSEWAACESWAISRRKSNEALSSGGGEGLLRQVLLEREVLVSCLEVYSVVIVLHI
eukprot:m.1114627 g.1114627  ORF g.1114627 m.1114627 type:complete len:96 (+) comp24368_c0_seq7:510-797(+)